MSKKTVKNGNKVKSSSGISKAFTVIRLLRASPSPYTLARIAEEVGIAASTAHSVLTELLAQGVVIQDNDKRYQLGPTLFYLGSAYARHTPLFRSVWVELVDLANDYAVTVALAVPWADHHLIISAHRAGGADVEVAFGGHVPLDAGSWGKVHYAFSGAEPPTKLTKYTERTITKIDAYSTEIELVRGRGYATDDEEFSRGVAGVAVPISSYSGYEGFATVLTAAQKMKEITVELVSSRLTALASRATFALGGESGLMFGGSTSTDDVR